MPVASFSAPVKGGGGGTTIYLNTNYNMLLREIITATRVVPTLFTLLHYNKLK